MSKNIFQIFTETCQAYPDKVCLKSKKGAVVETLTYAQLYEKVLQLSHHLKEKGLKPGQRAAILLSNSPYWPVAFFAVVSLQAVAVPIDIQLNQEDIKNILFHSASRILLTEEKFGVSLGELLKAVPSVKVLVLDRQDSDSDGKKNHAQKREFFSADKLAALFYTSGTTQEHKAVMLTHKNLLSNYASIRKLDLFSKDDVVFSVLPLHHSYPFMVACFAPLLEGSTVCYLATVLTHELFTGLKENEVTIFVGVPQLFSLMERSISDRLKKFGPLLGWGINRFIDAGLGKVLLKDLHRAFGDRLRFFVSGGAKLDAVVGRHFNKWGFKIFEGYGLTETSPVVTFNEGVNTKFDSVGKPIPGVEVRIAETKEGQGGEIIVRGDNVMLGYYRAPKLTKSVLRDQWFFTGDLGFIDRQGYLTVNGRVNELIVLSSGKKINPEKIEAHYLKSPYLKEMCILCLKSGAEPGQLLAVIVPDEDYLRAQKYVNIQFKVHWELENYSQKLPPYQRLKGFVLTSESLPRTRLGKLMRYKIEELYRAGVFKQAQKKESKEEKLSRFEELALGYLSGMLKKDVKMADHLELDLGLDSLGRIELLSSLQDLVSVGIDDALALELFQARTVRELITRARQALPESAFSGLLKRDDTVFWSSVLKEPLTKEDTKKIKLHFDLFDKFVTFLETLIFKFTFRVIFSLKIEGRENIPKDGPFVIVANHVTYLDAFFVLCALPFRLFLKTYFVGFGGIFNHPLVAWGERFHRLIPIDADLNLAQTLKICRFCLTENKILVYFPEGQRSIDGELKEFRKGIGILAKESNARILPIYLAGAYKVWPRTHVFPLPMPVTIKIGKVLDVSGISSEKGEDIYVSIANKIKEKISELEKG